MPYQDGVAPGPHGVKGVLIREIVAQVGRRDPGRFEFLAWALLFGVAESLAAVSYINDSYGMSDIQRILERLSQGNSTEAALRATIHSDYGQLETDLARYLADKYGE